MLSHKDWGALTDRSDLRGGRMGTVLEFKPSATAKPRDRTDARAVGEIVIFPGVRIERCDLDLGHRVRNSAGSGEFNDLGSGHRPRQTS